MSFLTLRIELERLSRFSNSSSWNFGQFLPLQRQPPARRKIEGLILCLVAPVGSMS
jgi:hypothetical protein